MKKMFSTMIPALLLLLMVQPAKAYDFTITGNVQYFSQPASYYLVQVYSQDFTYYQYAMADSLGNYTLTLEFPEGTNPALTVSTHNLCPDDVYLYENIIPFEGTTVLDFLLCDPATTCLASFYFEQDSNNPLTVNFIDNSLVANAAYLWDFGDGTTSTLQNPTHTYTESGYNFISLTVSNDSCSNTLSYWLLIADLAACNCPTYLATYCDTLPDGTPISFTNLCEAQCYGYDNATPCYDSTYCYSYFYYGPDTLSATTIFFQSISYGVVSDYLWDFGDGNTSTEANPIHTYSEDGLYLVTLSTTTTTGCTSFYYTPVQAGTDACNCPHDYAPVCIPTASGTDIIIYNSCLADCIGLTDYENCNGALYCNADFGLTLVDSTSFTYQFTDNSSGEDLSYQWYFGDGNSSTEMNPTHTYLNEGFYLVGLEIYSSDGCYDYFVYYLTVGDGQADCQASYYYLNDWQNELTVLFYDQSNSFSGAEISEWLWDFGDGNTSTEQNPTHTYATTGSYSVTLTVTYNDGCQSSTIYHVWTDNGFCTCPSDYEPVCVLQPDGTYFSFSNACWAECSGYFDYVDCAAVDYCQASFYYYQDNFDTLAVSFVDLSIGNINSWLWDFGDGNTSTEQNPTHTYAAFGEYQISLTITTDSICTSTISNPIYLYDETGLPACYSYFWFEQMPDDMMTFNFTDYSASGVDSWYWNFGDGQTSTEQNPSITFAAPGVYLTTLTVNDADAGCTNTYSMLLWADTVALYSNSCQALFLPQVSGLEVSYHDFSYLLPGAQYAWDFGDGNTSTEQYPVHLYEQPGTYTTTLTITDLDGCTSSFSVTINLLSGEFWGNSAPSAFAIMSDVEEQQTVIDQYNLYPNPAADVVNLVWKKNAQTGSNAQLSLQSITGQLLWSSEQVLSQGKHQLQIPLTNLPAGMYLLKIADGGQQQTLKLVKE